MSASGCMALLALPNNRPLALLTQLTDYSSALLPINQPTNPAISPQEMIALGCSNFFGSFFKIHVICCALSVTLAVDGAGGKSQVSFVSGDWGRSGNRATVPEKSKCHGHVLLTQLASIPPNNQLGNSQVTRPANPLTPSLSLTRWPACVCL